MEEGRQDGSIQTENTKELFELLLLINFWLMPSVFPAFAKEVCHKYRFIMKELAAMGLPLMDWEMLGESKNFWKILYKEKSKICSGNSCRKAENPKIGICADS